MARKKKAAVTKEEITSRIQELDKELYLLRDELALNRKLEKPHLLRQKKREKARALTFLTQLEKGALNEKKA